MKKNKLIGCVTTDDEGIRLFCDQCYAVVILKHPVRLQDCGSLLAAFAETHGKCIAASSTVTATVAAP